MSHAFAAAAAKSLQSCLTLCDPINGSPPAPQSLGFSRQEHWSRLPFPAPTDLPDPGIEPSSPNLCPLSPSRTPSLLWRLVSNKRDVSHLPLAEEAQGRFVPTVFQDHTGGVSLGFLIQVAHDSISPGLPTTPTCPPPVLWEPAWTWRSQKK